MKILLIILATALLLYSCSPARHLARFEKHHPELFKRDTIWHFDTLSTREVHHDTVFNYNQKDTIVMHEGKLTVKYFYTHDSVYLRGQCAPDTIIKRIPYVIEKSVIPAKRNYRGIIIGGICLVLAAFSIGAVISKIR